MEQKGRKKKQTLKRRAKLCQGVGALKRRTCIVQTLLLHKEGMRLFKYGCNGRGMGNFYEKLGGGGGGGPGTWEFFKVSLHSWQSNANPLLYENPLYCLPFSFFEILSKLPPPSPSTSLSPPTPTPIVLSIVLFYWLNG